jgi:hypothetical protein
MSNLPHEITSFPISSQQPLPAASSFVMRSRVTLAILCLITSLTLNRRDIATCNVHFSAKLVKSIGNIKYRHVTFSEI